MKNDKLQFSIFIISYKRANSILTMTALDKSGSTAPRYIIVGDDDPEKEEYLKQYDNVIIFNKDEYMNTVDSMDNFKVRGVPVYVRNFCYDYARKQGIEHFIMLDDDYSAFTLRFIQKTMNGEILKEKRILGIDSVFRTFFEVEHSHLSLAFSQNGDYISGVQSTFVEKGYKFKIMNCFFCNTNYQIPFTGTLNEDLNAGLIMAKEGVIPLTVAGFSLSQRTTQQGKGGLTDSYLQMGTYVKSYYSLILQPSSVVIRLISGGTTENHGQLRLHHAVYQNKTFPKIIREEYKK